MEEKKEGRWGCCYDFMQTDRQTHTHAHRPTFHVGVLVFVHQKVPIFILVEPRGVKA
jgi:hypothetical protein